MGCSMTKLLHKGNRGKKEKGYEASLPEPPPPAPLDDRLPLSARQKFSIVKSWKAINRAMQPTGINMFLKLFEDNKEILSLFDKFKELQTRDEQAESLELAEHANIVMNSIDEGIRAMDNVDFFFDLLHQIGASHRRLPGFKKEYFWKIETPFLEAVKTTLDERYSENIEQVYKMTIRFIIETVIEGYDLAEGREVNDNVKETKSPDAPKALLNPSQEAVNSIRRSVKGASIENGAASSKSNGAGGRVDETQPVHKDSKHGDEDKTSNT